jgi:hypothetical protein
MQYQTPQFIDVEEKLFGPFTFKQFLYLGGGVFGSWLLWNFIPVKLFAILLIIPFAGFAAALVFYKPNDRPFIEMLEHAFYYFVGNKMYLPKKTEKSQAGNMTNIQVVPNNLSDAQQYKQFSLPTVSDDKLKELAWKLDVKEKLRDEDDQEDSISNIIISK